ncbi:MAG: AraC family transcriptional regulator [Bacteroidaceae bacterium]|nr:AraC family transcriptional regulator [Bacteroidaceae bacterium]
MKTFWNIYIIGIVAALAIVGCGRGTGEQGLTHEEVVAINEQVLEKAIGQPDSALMMIEQLRAGDYSAIDTTEVSLQWSGPLPDYRCDYLRAKVYAQSLEGMWLDSAIIIGERLMTTDAAREDLAYQQDVLEMLINACRQHRDDEQAIYWLTQLIDLCHQNGDETEALRTEADLGLMLSGIGRADEGLAKIDSVLTLLSGKRKFNELDATITALKRKINVLKNMQTGLTPTSLTPAPSPKERGVYSPAPVISDSKTNHSPLLGRGAGGEAVGAGGEASIIFCAQQMLDLMDDYEQHPDVYHDGTYREPPEHMRPLYIDFFRAQAYMFIVEGSLTPGPSPKGEGSIYSQRGGAADKGNHSPLLGRGAGGEALSLFEQTNYAKSFSARKDMAPTYGLLGQYDKMLAIHDEQEARLREQGDTVCAEYATILRDRAMAAEARGHYAEANAYHRRYEALTAILNDRLLQGKANLYAARFHAAEQQREIERHKTTSRYLAIVGSCLAVVAVLALLFAAYVVHKRRIVDQKNRALVKQIAEAAEYRKKVDSLTGLTPGSLTPGSLTPGLSPNGEGSGYTQGQNTNDAQTAEVSTPLSIWRGAGGEADLLHLIKSEQLYLDPHFDRQAACDHFHLTKERIGAIFAQAGEYASFTDYINRLRLDHARELITTRPDMSIDEVATTSGFSVRRTFSRLFKEKFGLTPTEFREVASKEANN